MKYQVIARKFRPQVFEDVIGQDPIVQTLRNAIDMGRIGHAYLFSGPRGVGKTTMARLLAKALNCADGPTATPCRECASCQEVALGNSIDVLEIDAASNTGVDSIRELRENARYAPSRDRFKIFIIDEVHMLSTSAFNALLKTLEEPPSHIVFIMATTERHKLPATILSRCQQFIFRSIPPLEIHSHLKAISEREGIRIGEGALDYIVRAAGGSMRDAQSLLDQIIAFGGQEIEDEHVRDVLGFMPADLLNDAVNALAERDPARMLAVVERVAGQGLHFQQFVRELMAQIRDLLLAKIGLVEKISGSPDDRMRIETQAAHFSEQDLVRFFDVLMGVEGDLRWTSEPRFHLEIACIKLTEVSRLSDLEDVIRDMKSSRSPGPQPEKPAPLSPPATDQVRVPNAASGEKPPGLPGVKTGRPPRASAAGGTPRTGAAAQPAPSPASRQVEAVQSRPVAGPAPASQPHSPARHAPDEPRTDTKQFPTTPPDEGATMEEVARTEPAVQRFLDVFRGEIAQVRSTGSKNKPGDRK